MVKNAVIALDRLRWRAVDPHVRGSTSLARDPSPQVNNAAQLFSTEWWCACIGVLAITLVGFTSDLAIGVYLLCCILVFVRDTRASLHAILRFLPLMAYPALAFLSYIWSDAPDITKKQALELILFFATAIILCRPLGLNGLASALQIGTFVCCVLCLAAQPNAFLGNPLRGVVGSKNQVAFIAQILLLSSLAVAADARAPRPLRLQAATGVALAALEIHLAQSAGGLISSVGAVGAFLGVFLAGRLRLAPRIALIVGVIVTISPLLFVATDVIEQVQVFQLNVLHKDSTLTGRTGLWDFAHSLISERPILGHGFDAFWRQGNADAEGLWQQFGIGSRMGFNFHNQFVEAQVDLGRVGLCVLIASLMFVGVPAIWRAVREPSLSTAFGAALLVALYIKLPVESVLIGSWNIYSLVFIAIGMKAISGGALPEGARPSRAAPGAWRRRSPPSSPSRLHGDDHSDSHASRRGRRRTHRPLFVGHLPGPAQAHRSEHLDHRGRLVQRTLVSQRLA